MAFLFPQQIIALFRRDDPAVIQYGSVILRAQMATLSLLPVCSTGFVMLQGIGKNRDAAIVGSGQAGPVSGAADSSAAAVFPAWQA